MKSAQCRNAGELDPALVAEMSALGRRLRTDLDTATELPAHFWSRQKARVRERLRERKLLLRWPIAALAALAALSFALLSIKPPAPAAPASAQAVDSDDLLLRDIQYSIAQRAPEPLMPASILVQEMTTDSTTNQNTEN